MFVYYWPAGVPRNNLPTSYIAAFRRLGFRVSDDPELEPGVEKIAFFVKDGEVKHAARQLPDGSWTSKLGKIEDIVHDDLEAVEGEVYGRCAVYMARAVEGSEASGLEPTST